jgi:hypothetical protein
MLPFLAQLNGSPKGNIHLPAEFYIRYELDSEDTFIIFAPRIPAHRIERKTNCSEKKLPRKR